MQHKRAHDHQWADRILKKTAATERNIRLIAEIISSQTGMAYHIARRRTRVSAYWLVLSVHV